MTPDVPLVGGRLVVGDVEVTALSDGFLRFDPTAFFHTTDDADWETEEHARYLDADGRLTTPIGAFLIRSGGKVALVDTGLRHDDGSDWRGGRLLDALAAVGHGPDDIDTVAVTHLHLDHIGWMVDGTEEGAPTFSRASHRVSEADWEWARGTNPKLFGSAIAPVEGLVVPAADGDEVVAGVTVRAAPGHTPGHMVMVIASRGERALLLGDAIHCPVQLSETDWAMMGDADPALAVRTREALLRELDDSATAVATAHFPGLEFGRIVTGGAGRSWTVLPAPPAPPG